VDAAGLEIPADWDSLRSPENYTGYARTENFASPGGVAPAQRQSYSVPGDLRLNHWALAGDWTIGAQAAVVNEAGGKIAYTFQARDLHLVMGPEAEGTPVPFRVLLDGEPPGPAHGADTDEEGHGTLTQQRLHQLVRQPGPVARRTFEITFAGAGAGAYAFTFG
jgi:hypothetical protein